MGKRENFVEPLEIKNFLCYDCRKKNFFLSTSSAFPSLIFLVKSRRGAVRRTDAVRDLAALAALTMLLSGPSVRSPAPAFVFEIFLKGE